MNDIATIINSAFGPLIDEMRIFGWLWLVPLAVVIGGIAFYKWDLKRRLAALAESAEDTA